MSNLSCSPQQTQIRIEIFKKTTQMYYAVMRARWLNNILPGKPLAVYRDQAAAGGLPSSWLCSATLHSHFCPKPERNNMRNNVKKYC